MRILLAGLMCLVMTAVQCFAISGGPPYPTGSNIVGTYSGVLQGVFDPTNPSSSNSIGIFSLGVPKSGNASGSFVMFSRGRVFRGTAQAFADPQKSTLKGILDASFNYTLIVPTTSTDSTGKTTVTFSNVSVTASANGPINAKVTASKTSSSTTTTSTTVLRGDATLNVSQGEVAANGEPVITSILSLVVSGVKQSDTPSVGSALSPTG